MATNYATNIVSNTGEDFVDELISNMVYRETEKVMKEVKTELDLKEDSYLDEAIESALTTFQHGIMNAVIVIVSEYAITKTSLIVLGLVTYIKGSSFIKNLKDKSASAFQRMSKTKGAVVGRVASLFSSFASGKQQDTLAIAKITSDSANNIVTNVSLERNNQILLAQGKKQRVDAFKSNMYSVRNKSRDKNMSLFVWKTSNGMWEKTQKDEKLYFDCVGRDSTTVVYTVDFVQKLNSLADVVKTAKGEIITRAKAEIDMITAIGATVKG